MTLSVVTLSGFDCIGRRRAHVGVRSLLAEEVIVVTVVAVVVVVVVVVEVVVERTRVGIVEVAGVMGRYDLRIIYRVTIS